MLSAATIYAGSLAKWENHLRKDDMMQKAIMDAVLLWKKLHKKQDEGDLL